MKWRASSSGFTIVELLIVVVVIAILASITIVSYNGITARAKDSTLETRMNQIVKALDIYYTDNGAYPKSANFGAMGLNDSTGVWPTQNMTGVTKSLILSPFDTSGAATSFREEGGWNKSAHANVPARMGYVSVIETGLQVPGHWTCWQSADVCTSYRLYWRTSDGVLYTQTRGEDYPHPECSTVADDDTC